MEGGVGAEGVVAAEDDVVGSVQGSQGEWIFAVQAVAEFGEGGAAGPSRETGM
ncbi:hypothetical protein ACH5A3_28620 [Streptomyces echinatus]|uniref:hypothetical protein n=1 Tax=Streptomyces echinatus TaxID=67293 RepID=UPI003793644F